MNTSILKGGAFFIAKISPSTYGVMLLNCAMVAHRKEMQNKFPSTYRVNVAKFKGFSAYDAKSWVSVPLQG